MPNASILARLGLFVQRDFLNAELCRLIQSEMVAADRAAAMIWPVGNAGVDRASSCARLPVRQGTS
jgi:hypothetical protein